uniref:Uncharacterized protein n=1 Tax=Arundo donax TaxID=35708 RepID=A0A0A9FTR9_ARUDO
MLLFLSGTQFWMNIINGNLTPLCENLMSDNFTLPFPWNLNNDVQSMFQSIKP